MVEILDVKLDLAMSLLMVLMANVPMTSIDSDPAHSTKLLVNHESKGVRHVRLVADCAQTVFRRRAKQAQTFLDLYAKPGHEHGVRAVAFEESLLLLLVVHDGILLDDFDLENGIPSGHLTIERKSEAFDVLLSDRHVLLYNVDVEVRREIVHMSAHRVSCCVDAKESDDWLSCVFLLV